MRLTVLLIQLAMFLSLVSPAAHAREKPPVPVLNQHVLAAIGTMPQGGGYEASQAAVDRLAASVALQGGKIRQDLDGAGASFCSGATYLVLLRVIEQLRRQDALDLPARPLARYADLGVKDGEEIFGRWNANGPGAAKLFADLGCGVNFTSFDHAHAGDFLKLWWTEAIGGRERGHLVVYLGHTATELTFWSSNQPGGYGRKSISRSKIRHHLFSRLTDHRRLARAVKLPDRDPFLAAMLQKDFTWAQVAKACRVQDTP